MSPYSGAGRLLLLGCSIGAVLAHSPVTEGNHMVHTYIHAYIIPSYLYVLTVYTYIHTYITNQYPDGPSFKKV